MLFLRTDIGKIYYFTSYPVDAIFEARLHYIREPNRQISYVA